MQHAIAKALRLASSRTNTNPSEEQKSNGTYRKGVFDWRGELKIAIENPKGSERSGVDKGGKRWSVTMPAAYGEVKKTSGADGDAVDAYVGSDHSSPTVWVVDQVDFKTGAFDEHKAFLDFSSEDEVRKTYLKAFSDGKGMDRLGAITEMPVDAFIAWVRHGHTKEPLGPIKRASGGRIPFPQVDLARITSPSGVPFTVAKEYAQTFEDFLRDLEAEYPLYAEQSGGYNPRFIAGTRTPSQHAYGRAIDLNWADNPRGQAGTIPTELARRLAAKYGMTWGGDWRNPDAMHFELARDTPTPMEQRGIASVAGHSAASPPTKTSDFSAPSALGMTERTPPELPPAPTMRKSNEVGWVDGPLGLMPKWSDDSTPLQRLKFADGGTPPFPGDEPRSGDVNWAPPAGTMRNFIQGAARVAGSLAAPFLPFRETEPDPRRAVRGLKDWSPSEVLSGLGYEPSVPPIIPEAAYAVGKLGNAAQSMFGAKFSPEDVYPTNEEAGLLAGLAMTGGLAVPRPTAAMEAASALKMPPGRIRPSEPVQGRVYRGTAANETYPNPAVRQFWSSDSPSVAAEYAAPDTFGTARTIPADVNFENPLIVEAAGRRYDDLSPGRTSRDIADWAQANGYDGLVIRNVDESIHYPTLATTHVGLQPGTVRSATTGETLFSNPKETSWLGWLLGGGDTATLPRHQRAQSPNDAVPLKTFGPIPEGARRAEGPGGIGLAQIEDNYFYITRDGKPIGAVSAFPMGGGRTYVPDIGVEGGAHSLGVSGVRDIREAFRQFYPDQVEFYGGRVSGSRRGPAAAAPDRHAVMQKVTLFSNPKEAAPVGVALAGAQKSDVPIRAWHASGSDFDAFDPAFSGRPEGGGPGAASIKGGFSFTENPKISGPEGSWTKAVNNERGRAHVYDVEINVDPAITPDLSKPFSEQPPAVQRRLLENEKIIRDAWRSNPHYSTYAGQAFDDANPAHWAAARLDAQKDRSAAIASLEDEATAAKSRGERKFYQRAADILRRGEEPARDLFSPTAPIGDQFGGENWGFPPRMDEFKFPVVRSGGEEIVVTDPSLIKILNKQRVFPNPATSPMDIAHKYARPKFAGGGAPPFPGDVLGRESSGLPLDRRLEDYPGLRDFESFGGAEIRGTGPGESRDPQRLFGNFTGERPSPYMQPVAEMISPTMGAYGLGQAVGETGMAVANQDWGHAAEMGLPLAAMALGIPGAKGVRMGPRELNEAGFYSPSLEAAKRLAQERGTVGQMRQQLLNAGAKPKELEAIGFDKVFPDPQAKVSRGDIEGFLRENGVGLRTKIRADQMSADIAELKQRLEGLAANDPERLRITAEIRARMERHGDENEPTRYESYSTPGGIPGSYREVVTTLPDEIRTLSEQSLKETDPAKRAALQEKIRGAKDNYTSSHWPGITNPLLHYRVKDFPSAPGANTSTRVLDELQSDWAQRARDQGIMTPELRAQISADKAAAEKEFYALIEQAEPLAERLGLPPGRTTPAPQPLSVKHYLDEGVRRGDPEAIAMREKISQVENSWISLMTKEHSARNGVPSAPYISNTSDWVDLGLKQVLMDAARDPSVSRFAWAPGKVQNDRYKLERVASGLQWSPDTGLLEYLPTHARRGQWHSINGDQHTAESLPNVIGREMTDRLLAQEPKIIGNQRYYELYDLAPSEIGGHGMRSFYGDFTPEGSYNPGIVGTRLLKLIKGIDSGAAVIEPYDVNLGKARTISQVVQNDLGHRGPLTEDWINRATPAWEKEVERGYHSARYPSIKITPKLREHLLKEGFPLFSATPAALMGLEQALTEPDEGRATGGSVSPALALAYKYAGRDEQGYPELRTPSMPMPWDDMLDLQDRKYDEETQQFDKVFSPEIPPMPVRKPLR